MNNNNASEKVTAILGAGPAGLACGWRLARKGNKVVIFEKNDNVGGLGGGIVLNGNIYEYGPHLFHTTDPEIFKDIMELAKDELFQAERPILIKFLGSYFKYPLSIPDVVSKLPPKTIVMAFSSFIIENVKALLSRSRPETSETVLLKNYGRVLYEIFFKNYIEHVWGIPPAKFSPKFARQRIPQLSAIDFLFKLISKLDWMAAKKIKTPDFVEKVEGSVYSTKRGFSIVAERMAQDIKRHGGDILTSSEVTKLKKGKTGKFRVEVKRKDHGVDFDAVINTVPINRLVEMVEPPLPEDARSSAEKLEFRSIVFVGLLISKKRVLPASILYFREMSFNRITDLSYFGFDPKPAGHTLLIAEIACGKKDRSWTDDLHAIESVVRELIKEGLITADMIKESHAFRSEYAYPVFTIGFEENLNTILKALGQHRNLLTTGRQGMFKYINIHVAIRMGYEAADEIGRILNER